MADHPHASSAGESLRDASPPKLLEQVRAAIRTRHYSRRTEAAYVGWIRRFIVFHGKRHPRDLGAVEVTAFVSALAARRVSASTQNQALSAVLFLFEVVLGHPNDPGAARASRRKYDHDLYPRAESGRARRPEPTRPTRTGHGPPVTSDIPKRWQKYLRYRERSIT